MQGVGTPRFMVVSPVLRSEMNFNGAPKQSKKVEFVWSIPLRCRWEQAQPSRPC